MDKLLASLKEICVNNSIPLVGVAPVERFENAPRGHHPRDFLSTARSVVVIGMPIMKGICDYFDMLKGSQFIPENIRKEYLQGYFYQRSGYETINDHLSNVALRMSFELEENGFRTLYFYPSYGQLFKNIRNMLPELAGIFSMRHAAVRAGLGEFGLINLVLNPIYGPRVRYNALITEAELPPSSLLNKKVCLGSSCKQCIKLCGTGAISAGNPSLNISIPDETKVWLDPVSRTEKNTCSSKRMEAFCFGKCLMVCMAGSGSK